MHMWLLNECFMNEQQKQVEMDKKSEEEEEKRVGKCFWIEYYCMA